MTWPAVLLSCPDQMFFVSALHTQMGTGLQCLSSNAHLLILLCDTMHAVFSGCFIHSWIIYQLMIGQNLNRKLFRAALTRHVRQTLAQ